MSSDYGYEPKTGAGLFLRLKAKGDSVKIRLVSPPYREPKVWVDGQRQPIEADKVLGLKPGQWMTLYRDPKYTVNELFHWGVIDRADGEAKLFSGPAGVYKQIKAHAEMTEWGDPTGYDFTVTRTEEPGPTYYKVTALPNKEDKTTKEEKDKVANLDFAKLVPVARRLSEEQVDQLPEGANEPTPEPLSTVPPEAGDDIVIEDLGDEPVNLDDIPF